MYIANRSALPIATLALFCLLLPFPGNTPAADAAATPAPVPLGAEAAPPRTVADIVKILDHYKPDPSIAAKAREASSAQPPASTDRKTLLRFYIDRSRAASRIGSTTQQINDLRKAREYMDRGDFDALAALRELSVAENVGGNIVNTIQILQEIQQQIPSNLQGMVISNQSHLWEYYDSEDARKTNGSKGAD